MYVFFTYSETPLVPKKSRRIFNLNFEIFVLENSKNRQIPTLKKKKKNKKEIVDYYQIEKDRSRRRRLVEKGVKEDFISLKYVDTDPLLAPVEAMPLRTLVKPVNADS